MILIVRTCALYDVKNKAFKAAIAVNSRTKNETRSRKFFGATFKKQDVSLKQGVMLFSKYCLKEYYYLTRNRNDSTMTFIIQYTNNKIMKMFYNKDNLWFDQLVNLLGADGDTLKFEKKERKICLKI